MKTLTDIGSLRAQLSTRPESLLFHVLPAELFEARRIPGSRNACVYEVRFLSQVGEAVRDKTRPIIVYGAGGGSLDARVAGEKLAAAGYTDVAVFEGGIDAWQAAGEALEGTGVIVSEPLLDGDFRVDTEASAVRWTGRNLLNHHHGTVKLDSGQLKLRRNQIIGGRLVLNMRSITCEDIQDRDTNAMLIRHLWDADFFQVDRYPSAEFVVQATEPIPGSTDGTPNWNVTGQCTLRGVARPLGFPVVLGGASADRLTVQAQFEIDRTNHGSVYGSGRLFRFLGKHVVNDHVHLHVKVHADKAKV